MEGPESSEGGARASGDWLGEWKIHTRLLRSVLQAGAPDVEIRKLLADCFAHYSTYLTRRTAPPVPTAEPRALPIGTSLEAAFTWLGGWRPSSAVVMVSSLLKAEVGVVSAAATSSAQSPCYLTEEQLTLLDPLQAGVRQSELEFSHELSMLQMLVADQSMLSALTICSATVKDVIETKIAALNELLSRADTLRLHTLHQLFNLLTPVQAARTTVAAFEIVFMMRSMGSNSTLMRSMSASEATLEKATMRDMLPTIQNLDVPVHAGLALEASVRPVTLSFPIVPAPVLTGSFGVQNPLSTLPRLNPNVEGQTLDLIPTLMGPFQTAPRTPIERTPPSVAAAKVALPTSSTPQDNQSGATGDSDKAPLHEPQGKF